MKLIGVRVPPEVKAKLEELAGRERRTLAQLCRIALEDFLKQRKAA